MDAQLLLKTWPGWANANASRVLASPAWRFTAKFGGKSAVLTRDADSATLTGDGATLPRISLAITQDGAPGVVTFEPSSLFPDLFALKDHLGDLPREVLLALVEKECGQLFQFFEDVGRQSFSVAGLSDAPSKGMGFVLTTEDGTVRFAIDVPSSVELFFGEISNLDAGHASIRELTRAVTARYAALELSDVDADALKAGDCLVLPEKGSATWGLEIPMDALAHVVAPEERTVTFAEIADDALGPVPEPTAVKIVRRGSELATGEIAKLGTATVVRVLTRA